MRRIQRRVRAFLECLVAVSVAGGAVIVAASKWASAERFVLQSAHLLVHIAAEVGRPHAMLIALGICLLAAVLISTHIHFGDRIPKAKDTLLGAGVVAMAAAVLIAWAGNRRTEGPHSTSVGPSTPRPAVEAYVPPAKPPATPATKPSKNKEKTYDASSRSPGSTSSSNTPHAVEATYPAQPVQSGESGEAPEGGESTEPEESSEQQAPSEAESSPAAPSEGTPSSTVEASSSTSSSSSSASASASGTISYSANASSSESSSGGESGGGEEAECE